MAPMTALADGKRRRRRFLTPPVGFGARPSCVMPDRRRIYLESCWGIEACLETKDADD